MRIADLPPAPAHPSPPSPSAPAAPTAWYPHRANGQPAFGLYLADPHVSTAPTPPWSSPPPGDHITGITGFNTNVMTRFGLPRTLPETD